MLKAEEKSNLDLLNEYLETKNEQVKQQVILRYSYIVKTIALQMRATYQNVSEVEDIINEGIIALINAIDRFDKSKDVKFESYASLRIRGSIIDYVRKQYWAPRRISKLSKDIDSAQKELFSTLGRYPKEEEIAQHMGLTVKQYLKAVQETNTANLLSFDSIVYENQNITNISFINKENTCELPESNVERKELSELLEKYIDKLSEKEQMVISLYYKNDLSIKQIAKIFGVSEPRVSQIHSSAIRKLRVSLKSYIEI